MESTSNATTSSFRQDHGLFYESSSPDPTTMKALKAGEELLDALDHAFAEFENERLELSQLEKSGNGFVGNDDVMMREKKLQWKNLENSCSSNTSLGRDESVSGHAGIGATSASSLCSSAPVTTSHSTCVENSSEVSDELNTEQVLGRELEQRVSEWIRKVESGSGQEQESLSTTSPKEKHIIRVHAEEDVKNNGNLETLRAQAEDPTKNFPHYTPVRASNNVEEDRLPVTSIKSGTLEQLVSPLGTLEDFAEHNVQENENHHERLEARKVHGKLDWDQKVSFDHEYDDDDDDDDDDDGQKNSRPCSVSTHVLPGSGGKVNPQPCIHQKDMMTSTPGVVDLVQDLDAEQENGWDDDNQWDFDDVDSLPSGEESDEKSNQDDDLNDDCMARNTYVPCKGIADATAVDVQDDDKSAKVENLKQQSNLAVQTNMTDCPKVSDPQNESPSPNDVVASIPFFNGQDRKQNSCEYDDNQSFKIQELQELLEKERQRTSQMQNELEQEKSNRLEIEKDLMILKQECAQAQSRYEADRNQFLAQYESIQMKLEAAENDAQEAIVLAEEAAMGRSEMEAYLQRALDELELFRKDGNNSVSENVESTAYSLPIIKEDGLAVPNNKNEDMACTPSRYTPRRISSRRAVVSAGRQLLRQAVAMENDDGSFASTQDGSTCSNLTDNTYYMMLSRKSAEKRQRLLDRLRMSKEASQLDKDEARAPVEEVVDSKVTQRLNRILKNVDLVIRKSGKTLGLGGRWFSVRSIRHLESNDDALDVETMTKSYCNSVEALIADQKNELNELRTFCQYLEEKVMET